MAVVIKPIGPNDLTEAARLVNESSRGHSFEFDLDLAKFLGLSSYWNFSYRHSSIAYANGVGAGVLLNTVEPQAQECYSFYWGVTPQFRGTTIALRMVTKFLNQVAAEGIRVSHADMGADSPADIFHRLGYRQCANVLQMDFTPDRALRKNLGGDVRAISMEEYLDATSVYRGEPFCWSIHPAALRNAARTLRCAMCRTTYAAFRPESERTRVIDFQFEVEDQAPALHLIEQLSERQVRFSYVLEGSPLYTLLSHYGYVTVSNFTALKLDLRQWAASRLGAK
jgi:hypothetical protein